MHAVGKIARRFTEVAVEARVPLRAVQPLRAAVAKIRAQPDQLTPVHADYLQVCLLAKLYKAGAALIEDDLVELEPGATGMQPRDALRYFYYAGLVLTGLKEYRRALEYVKLAWTAPAMCLSAIMLEAYKKYVLLALLVHGALPAQPPKYVSSMVQRQLKAACPQYLELATAYATRSTDELHKVGGAHLEAFTRDRNFGLVRQVIMSLYRRNIQRSTQTYLTISLADIADSVKLPNAKEAEKRILRMIEAGEVFATVSHRSGMVSFHEEPEKYDTTRTMRVIDHGLHRVMQLGARLRRIDETVSASTAYLQRTALHERGGRGGGGGGGGWGAGGDDMLEEMMLTGAMGERPPGMQL